MPIINAIDISDWRKVYIELAKKSYEGKLKPSDLNEDLIRNTYKELNQGAQSGYGKGWLPTDKGGQDKTALELQKNLYKFSCAKTYAQQLSINNALVKDGKIQSWNDFKNEVDKINSQYNINYLNTEYKTALQSANMAKNWKEYVRNKNNYPNLKYKTQGDDRVRDEHAAINEIIVPIDNVFWNSYYPPNGWNCRCYVEQTNEATTAIPTEIKNVPEEFKLNVGVSGQVFSEDKKAPAPYFALARTDKNFRAAFEFSKLAKPTYNEVANYKNGSQIVESIFSDVSDSPKNQNSAKIIAEKFAKTLIKIRPDLESGFLTSWKNPEYEINGLIGDRYEGNVYRGWKKKKDQIKNYIAAYNEKFPKAKISQKYSIVFDITNIDYSKTIDDVAMFFNGKFETGKKMDSIYFINGDKAVLIKRNFRFKTTLSKLRSLYK